MDLLLLLSDTPGDTLSRDTLFEKLWPDVIVSEDTLTQAVIKLRKAFGETAKDSTYIQTVSKRGYRLSPDIKVSTRSERTLSYLHHLESQASMVVIAVLVLIALLLAWPANKPQTSPSKDTLTSKPAAVKPPTLTVEPFTLLAEDSSQQYLADGMTHDLIIDLSKLSALRVISSRSVIRPSSHITSTPSSGYVVSGEFQRSKQHVKINVHLRNAETGHQIWSERYQRPMADLFQLQIEISREIAASLSVKISETEQRRLTQRYTHNIQAYEHFQRAQALLLVRMQFENELARSFYRQAITLDPSFARAYAGLALSYAADYRNQWVNDGTDALLQARKMARTALQIDSEIPEIYWVLAYVNTQQKQHDKAIALLHKAISIDPSFADAYALMGGIYTYTGKLDESVESLRIAIRLNPNAGNLYYLLLGRAYALQKDWEQASINLTEALARNPVSLEARIYRAITLISTSQLELAHWETTEILNLEPGFNVDNWLNTYPMTDQSQISFINSTLSQLDFTD